MNSSVTFGGQSLLGEHINFETGLVVVDFSVVVVVEDVVVGVVVVVDTVVGVVL